MIRCAVYGCSNSIETSDSSVQYYFFPKHPIIMQQWINACCIWGTEEIDVSTARICSIHFDNNSYTADYKMVDYLGVYTKVLKFDAVPTLYLPQQTTVAVMKSQLDSPSPSVPPDQPNEMKQIIVFGIPSTQQQDFVSSYESGNLILENVPQPREVNLKYEELRSAPPTLSETTDLKEDGRNIPESDGLCNNMTYKQYKATQAENEKLRKDVARLETWVANLKYNVAEKTDTYKKIDGEYNRLLKLHNSLERKSMSVGDQKNLLSKVFSESQIKILSGKKKIYWSNDDMAIGYTIRHMSSKRCYMYLSKNLNIPLPALSSIKRWQTLKKGEYVKEETVGKEDTNCDSDE